jgi:CubicO group peptidase (beta-lactamase class C family)
MKNFLTPLLLGFCLASGLSAQSLYFPPTTGNTWDTLSPSRFGWCPSRIDSLYGYLDTRNSRAFILLKDGKIVLEQYFNGFTQDSLWYWASAGKGLTAFTVGIAQAEGHLRLEDTTSRYLGAGWTAAPADKEEKITIWHQLTMTTGLNDGVPDHFCTLDTCLQYLSDAGTRWAYHNAPYTLLDGVLSQATGQTLNQYVTQKIKNPTGMTGLFVPVGYNNVFVSNARSMARFGLLVLGRGRWNGTPVLTDTAYFNQMVNSSQPINPAYGYLWWLNGKSSFMVPGLQFSFPGSIAPAAPADMYSAIGKNGQLISVVPSQNLVFIRMGDSPDGSDVSFLLMDTIWQKINFLGNCPTGTDRLSTEIKIFPNPLSKGQLLQVQGLPSEAWLELSDALGRVWWRERLAAGSHSLSFELPSGWYQLRLQGQDWQQVQRLRWED